MVRLVISTGDSTSFFNPLKDYFDIYDFLKDELGWDHEAADDAASWAEMAKAGSSYEVDDPDLEIYLEEY